MHEKNQKCYFENLGKDFDEYMSDYDVERRKSLIFNHLLRNCAFKGKHVLEVGSGTGRFSMEINNRGGDLTVLDIGKNLVKYVSMSAGCPGSVGDAGKLPFTDNAFDLIISSECIEHTLDPEKAIQEMCRVCRSGGYVCITTPNRIWYPILLLSQRIGIRKFSGIENWIYPHQARQVYKEMHMSNIQMGGCHLLPFQLKVIRPFLYRIDRFGRCLFPLMINFGIVARKD